MTRLQELLIALQSLCTAAHHGGCGQWSSVEFTAPGDDVSNKAVNLCFSTFLHNFKVSKVNWEAKRKPIVMKAEHRLSCSFWAGVQQEGKESLLIMAHS